MSCNVVLEVLFGDRPDIICRTQDWSAKGCILECSCMEMIKYNFLGLSLDLYKIEADRRIIFHNTASHFR